MKKKFEGKIELVSLSPHGDPEGVVLESGDFIKTPPHSLRRKDLFRQGAHISGEGELISSPLNAVIHHARVLSGEVVLSDDSLAKPEKEKLKAKHHEEHRNREKAPAREISFSGRLAAIGLKPKGEIDRLLFEDGTSEHLPKEIEIRPGDLATGAEISVRGEGRRYGSFLVIKASDIKV